MKLFYDSAIPVPYPAGHREDTRKKIVRSARRLFNELGFDNVSINQIMAGAGLTRGAFYSYFESKSDLYAEVLSCFFTDPDWSDSWKGVHVDRKAADVGRQIIRAYLSRQHLESKSNTCPMVALPSDVARSGAGATASPSWGVLFLCSLDQKKVFLSPISSNDNAQFKAD
jgi:TetR/AcrR family transcriptional repressor of nem operon